MDYILLPVRSLLNNSYFLHLQYDENSANSPSVGGASPGSTDTTGPQLTGRPAGGNDNHEQSGTDHNGTKQNKTSNIQVRLINAVFTREIVTNVMAVRITISYIISHLKIISSFNFSAKTTCLCKGKTSQSSKCI